jgi:hypothetical protein
VAPLLIGGGVHAVEGLPIGTIADAVRFEVEDVTVLGTGSDLTVRLTMTPRRKG